MVKLRMSKRISETYTRHAALTRKTAASTLGVKSTVTTGLNSRAKPVDPNEAIYQQLRDFNNPDRNAGIADKAAKIVAKGMSYVLYGLFALIHRPQVRSK